MASSFPKFSSWKKGVFSKGAHAEIACNVISPSLGCTQWEFGKEMLGSKLWLVWQWATRRENPKLQNWNEESAVQRGVCSALCNSGLRRRLAAKFRHLRHFPHPLFYSVWRPGCEKHNCGGLFEGSGRAGFSRLVWRGRGPFRASHLNTHARRTARGSKRRGTWTQENQILRNYPFSKNPFLQLLRRSHDKDKNGIMSLRILWRKIEIFTDNCMIRNVCVQFLFHLESWKYGSWEEFNNPAVDEQNRNSNDHLPKHKVTKVKDYERDNK